MARGWESKDVEAQINGDRAVAVHHDPHNLTSDVERERINKQTSLQMDRARVSNELITALNERFRLQLRAELAYIDLQLATLEPKGLSRAAGQSR